MDTSTVVFSSPFKNEMVFGIGYSSLKQLTNTNLFNEDWFYSWAVSATFKGIHNSTRKLAAANIEKIEAQYFDETLTSSYQNTGSEKSYFIGSPEFELFTVPRFDFFLRYRLGKERPYLGIIGAYSPHISSITELRQNVALGLSVSPATLPDQIIFAIINEWIEDSEGDMKYSLNFRASFPIKFN
jgi:hypothetical protein